MALKECIVCKDFLSVGNFPKDSDICYACQFDLCEKIMELDIETVSDDVIAKHLRG